MEAQAFTIDQPFQAAYEKFIEITSHLSAKAPGAQPHSDIAASLETDGRELLRLLLQEHVDQQGPGRIGAAVRGSDGVVRSHKRERMETGYQSVFGAVRVARTGYSQRGASSVFPRDAQLHLPRQSSAHRLQKRVAAKATKMAFESVASDIETETGVRMGTRQIAQIVLAAAQDFDAFDAQPCSEAIAHHAAAKPMQVFTFDGKGVVMRQEAWREATRKRAKVSALQAPRGICPPGPGPSQTHGDGGGHLPHGSSCAQCANGGAAVRAVALGAPAPPGGPQAGGQKAVGESGKADAHGD